jgi:DNA-directed RNA polymerase delta subunit
MESALQQVLADVQAKIQSHLEEIKKLKRTANNLADMAGEMPIYTDIDIDQETGAGVGPNRSDAYYGKRLATACREYLEFRKKAVPVEEILNGLLQGGFDFEALEWSPSTRLRALAMSMSKNTAVFHRLPNNTWGLLAWYPAATERRTDKTTGGSKKSAKAKRKRKSDNKKKGSAGGILDAKTKTQTGSVETPAHKVVYATLQDGELHAKDAILKAGKDAGVMPIAIFGILRNAKDIETVGDSYKLKKEPSRVEDMKTG